MNEAVCMCQYSGFVSLNLLCDVYHMNNQCKMTFNLIKRFTLAFLPFQIQGPQHHVPVFKTLRYKRNGFLPIHTKRAQIRSGSLLFPLPTAY
jgi:hypothetical protein